MESGYPGVCCISYSEYWDIDPVWEETDEGGEDCPFHDLGKGIVGLTSRRTLSPLRRPATVGDVAAPGLSQCREHRTSRSQDGLRATDRQGLTPSPFLPLESAGGGR